MDVASTLKREFADRCTRNHRYSLRAFSRSLGMSHTIVSLVMSGKRPASARFLKKVESLFPPPYEHVKRSELSVDQFRKIASWLHYAILSYLDIPDTKLEASEIAIKLHVPISQARIAIHDLKTFRFISKNKDGRWKQSVPPFVVKNKNADTSCTDFSRQFIKKAEQALDQVSFERRDIRTLTLAMRSSDLEYARDRLMQFRRELCLELEQRGKPDAVFVLNTQFFSLME